MSQKGKKLTLDERLSKAKTALENTLNTPEILSEFTDLGYTAEKITVGTEKHSTVMNHIAKQKKEYGEKYAATEELQNTHADADKNYKRNLKIARILITDKASETALQLSGKRKLAYPSWIQQTTTFYTNILNSPERLSIMSGAGITEEKLTADLDLVKAVEKALQKQKKETGEAQAATVERDEAIDELFDWMSDFYQFADIALEDLPQWKEKLGILER